MLHEPVGRAARRLLQRAGFFKQMRRAGYQGELLLAVQQRIRLLVQFDHTVVRGADDEQDRRSHAAYNCAGEIGASTAWPRRQFYV